MFYVDLLFTITAALLSFIVFLYNSIKKYRQPINRLLSFIAFLAAIQFSFIAVSIFKISFPYDIVSIINGLMVINITLISIFLQLYPYVTKKKLYIYIFESLAGLILTGIIISSNIFRMPSAKFSLENPLRDIYYLFFLSLIIFISVISLVLLFINSSRKENLAFRRDMRYLFSGMLLFLSMLIISQYCMNYFWSLDQVTLVGAAFSESLIILILMYSVLDLKRIDLKKFYVRSIYWALIFVLLFLPVALLLSLKNRIIFGEKIPIAGITIFIFIYLFTVFKYIRTRIESVFERGYRNLADRIVDIFNPLQITPGSGEDDNNEDVFIRPLQGLTEKFKIKACSFYLLDRKENNFFAVYSVGIKNRDKIIDSGNETINLLNTHQAILHRPEIYYQPAYREKKESHLEFFSHYRIELILPLFDLEKRMAGFIMLGPTALKKQYSNTLIATIELFRIQFQQQLSNKLLLDRVKAEQVMEHDMMVVDSIKNKITPRVLSTISGFLISSFYINNSRYGGDFFDTIKCDDNSLIIFIADTSYSGVESALISLELFSVLHTPLKSAGSPVSLLNTMNRVISSSALSKKYSPAFCLVYNSSSKKLIYSNAAFNPLLLFNAERGNFIECDTQGVPVGVKSETRYTMKSIEPAEGTIGILYSDGFISAINESGDVFSIEKLKDIIRRDREQEPEIIIKNIYDDFIAFTMNKKQINDISLLIFKL